MGVKESDSGERDLRVAKRERKREMQRERERGKETRDRYFRMEHTERGRERET